MKALTKVAAAAMAGGVLVAGASIAVADTTASPSSKSTQRCGNDNRGGLEVVGLTDNDRLICFRANSPGSDRVIGKIKGLEAGDSLVGIDYRPKNGKLYGVGEDGNLYTINDRNAKAILVDKLSEDLDGDSFGVDVNPAADALRITSDTGENLRYSFAMGTTTADGELTNPAVAPATDPADATDVTGAAYTNNDKDADTATTLFDIDAALDRVSVQAPANNGTLSPTGSLGRNTTPEVGFDIYSNLRRGEAQNNKAYASLTRGNNTAFFRIDLLTGDAKKIGNLDRDLIGIAIPLKQG